MSSNPLENPELVRAALERALTELLGPSAGGLTAGAERRTEPIGPWLEEFAREQRRRARSETQAAAVVAKTRRLAAAAGWETVGEIDEASARRALADITEGGTGWHDGQGLATETSNKYLAAGKTFTAWLRRRGALLADPLAEVRREHARREPRHPRRALTGDELRRLVAAAERGGRIETIPGPARAVLYVVGAWTGLRKTALGSLRRESFRLEGDPPTVVLEARHAKNRRRHVVVLHPAVVARLRQWLPTRAPGELLWPISGRVSGGVTRKAHKFFRADCAAAGIDYRDGHGDYLDFHCLRHTFATNLARAGVPPKVAQLLLDHSDVNLTLSLYTHTSDGEQATAIRRLPDPPGWGGAVDPPPPSVPPALAATGTTDASPRSLEPGRNGGATMRVIYPEDGHERGGGSGDAAPD